MGLLNKKEKYDVTNDLLVVSGVSMIVIITLISIIIVNNLAFRLISLLYFTLFFIYLINSISVIKRKI